MKLNKFNFNEKPQNIKKINVLWGVAMNKSKNFKESGHERVRAKFINEIRRGNHKRVQEFLIIHGCLGGSIIKKLYLNEGLFY